MTIKIACDVKKNPVCRKIRSESYLLLPLYINRSITKKFLIKTLLKMTDSTCPRFFMLESVLSVIVLIGNFLVWTHFEFCKVAIGGKAHFPFFSQTLIFWCRSQFWLSYSNSPRFFLLETIISKNFSLGNIFVMDRFLLVITP